jgi:Family of unknown function (DUF5335)
MAGFVDRSEWRTFLDEFTKRNQSRPTHLEVVGDVGAQIEETHLPFVGIDFERKGETAGIEIALADPSGNNVRHLTHFISNVERIAPIVGMNGVEDGLGIEDRDGVKTLLSFEALPEIEAPTAGAQGSAQL